MVFDDLVTLIS